jgi:hypothetical protein
VNLSSLFKNSWPYLLLIVCAAGAYSNVYDNDFFFDDGLLILSNKFIRSWHNLGAIFTSDLSAGGDEIGCFYRPLQTLSYLIVAQSFDLKEWAFHALNVLLHVANGCLVFAFAQKLGLRRWPAFIAALLWVVHPLHTEAVTYMSATADVLHVFFILIALLVWRLGNIKSELLTGAAFILALLSKESAVIFPGLLVLTQFLTSPAPQRFVHYYRTLPYWIIAGAFFALHSHLSGCAQLTGTYANHVFYPLPAIYNQSIWARITTFFSMLPDYARLFAMPMGLHQDHMPPIETAFFAPKALFGFAAVILSAIFFITAFFRPKNQIVRLGGFGGMWFLVAYFPCTGIFTTANALFLEHWMYLPSIGLFIALAGILREIAAKYAYLKWPLGIAAGVMAALFGVSTWQQNKTWHDPFTFYTNILKYEPNDARAHDNLGLSYEAVGAEEEALEHYTRALELNPKSFKTAERLGQFWLRKGKYAKAEKYFKMALEEKPVFPSALKGLVDVYKKMGKAQLAREYAARLKAVELFGIQVKPFSFGPRPPSLK